MYFLLGKKELLLKSKFYNEENCWDYPIEELEHIIQESSNKDNIYVVCEDNRIYETECQRNNVGKLYKDLKQDTMLRDFELAALSVCLKRYIKSGIDEVNKYLIDWEKRILNSNPNIKEIENNFKIIIEPIEIKRLLESKPYFRPDNDFEHLNNVVYDSCCQDIDLVKAFIVQFQGFIEELANQEELEE